MKRLILSIFSIALVLSLNLNAQPKLEIVGGDSYNWNKVTPKESPLKATIMLKNTGKERLLINSVRPSCGCTAVLLDTSQLEPGQTAKLDVKLNITNKPGPVVKTIFIASNDPQNPNVNLYLKADVHVEIEVSPNQYFNFDDMKVGVESTSKVKIINHSTKSVTFTDILITPEYLKVNLPKELVLKPNEEFEIVATVKPPTKGYFGCNLKMKTSHPEYPEILIMGSSVVSDTEVIKSGQK